MLIRLFPLHLAPAFLLAALATPALAENAPPLSAFFDAALCQPPYSIDHATALYEAAEKLTTPDQSSLGGAIYHLPAPIERDGFTTQDVVFGSMTVGVLVNGDVADQLARRYELTPETSHLLGTSSKGFSRLLPDDQQGLKEMGLISIVAREGDALKGKTLLACEFVDEADRKAMERMEEEAGEKKAEPLPAAQEYHGGNAIDEQGRHREDQHRNRAIVIDGVDAQGPIFVRRPQRASMATGAVASSAA